MDAQQKLDQLKDKFTDADETDKATIAQWETELKKALVFDNLGEHDGVKMLMAGLKSNISEINDVLTNHRTLTDKERDIMFMKRDIYEWFVGLFTFAKSKAAAIEKNVDENLE